MAEIDALRGLAACGVAFFSHFNMLSGAKGGPLVDVAGFGWLYEHGTTLVDLFFVLSGFVMCHVYLERESSGFREGVTWRSYIVARIARLYPLHLLTLLIVAALMTMPVLGEMWAHHPNDLYHFTLNLFFLQRSGLEDYHSFNISAWSLTGEMAAYLAFFGVVWKLHGRLPSAFTFTILLALACLLTGVINLYVARGVIGFFAGAILWWHWPAVQRLPSWLIVILLVASFYLAFSLLPSGAGNYIVGSLLVWPLLIALSFRGAFSTVLSTRPLQWLGDISFSVYLLHIPVYFLRAPIFGPEPIAPEHWAAANLISAGLVLGAAHLSHRWFEQPARRWLRRAGAPRPQLAFAS